LAFEPEVDIMIPSLCPRYSVTMSQKHLSPFAYN